MTYRVGVDIGGSFTDFALFDEETKDLRSLKVFSRPDQPGAEVLEGVRLVGERYGIAPRDITYFTHGTTVGINTVIQRKGLRLALLTTEGFRDVLELGRLKIPDMYNLLSKRPDPLITRDLVYGIPGRILADGSEKQALDEAAVEDAVKRAQAAGAEGIVISFLHAYRNDAHERQAKAVVQRVAPGLPVFCSSETWPIIREYERTITSVIGGYVQPRVSHYLSSLQQALKDAGVAADPRLTKSNGGVMTAEQGKTECVQMILSGTASGVIGASYVAEVCGIGRCMSLDIGGTSADVAIIIDGQPQYGVGEKIGEFQIFIPSVSVSSIGEGGGSIAWVDGQGVLRVGPESAGSRPGPACYGRGGTRATITDAFVALGLIGHADLGYNAVKIDIGKAREVVGELADKLGRSVEETAEAIIDIAVSGMYSDVSGLVSRFGVDPREFSCLAFGGAGPMLACFLARELRMKEVVVPLTPGVLSALGGLIADLKNDFIKTVYLDLAPGADEVIRGEFAGLRERALKWLRDDQGYGGEYALSYSAEMRYRGQSFEIDTPLDQAAIEAGDLEALGRAFHAEHERIYGHSDPHAAIQVVTVRLVISGKTRKPEIPKRELQPGPARRAGEIEVYLDGSKRRIGLYHRKELVPGQTLDGPAVVAQDDCTTVVPPGFTLAVDAFANLRITAAGAVQ
ncbi:hydantoinase/oxoprolinase family protein [Enterovirga aerilata]|uniref:Hydantoinase/oxoprolinase family protein n=1 Tax=Enterovirga aerilata TaxID=2730920 RepID=A0A849IDG0_9HYPH|nr:hydantoinase/oxoprolinase family protein [Enterovirga sp. DB1703]NNM75271.1 hydantoinase/oxoprolinase family protein [Enterovirga sp. DB1703]